jgi:FlaA1/EpsC-like NDP-sugar epimerase
MTSILKGQNITVTGGTGSIGETIVRRALKEGAKFIKIFSNDENGLYELEEKLEKTNRLKFIIGDIRNEDSVRDSLKKTNLVFHAAALKHVDRCELNPFETVAVNIIGTNNVAKASIKEKVKKVISISTDKAVNPIGVMGATKLVAEKLIMSEAYHRHSNTVFSSVRFGNVINTRGSIMPHIENQIQLGGPITLTDLKMQRFFMTKEQAVDLIMSATRMAKGGEIFVLKMPLLRLEDLFDAMKQIIAPKYGFKPLQIKTKITGIRPGEKFTEYLLNDYEMNHALEMKDFFIIPPLQYITKNKYSGAKKPKNIHSYFENLKPLKKKEILKIIKDVYLNKK